MQEDIPLHEIWMQSTRHPIRVAGPPSIDIVEDDFTDGG
jgi:hypothetical protein